jgi:hypothetical protein
MSLTWLTPSIIEATTTFPEVLGAAHVDLDASPEEEEVNVPLADYLTEDKVEPDPEVDQQLSACDVVSAVKIIWKVPPMSGSYFSCFPFCTVVRTFPLTPHCHC